MQNELIDILIIGCLVVLFASTYRKRTTSMVRCWTVGWLLILVHYAVLLIHPARLFEQRFLDATSIAALIACGVVFLLPTGSKDDPYPRRSNVLLLLTAASNIAFVFLQTWDVAAAAPYYLATGLGAACWFAYSARLRRKSSFFQILLALSTIATTAWLLWAITHGRPDIGVSAILTQLYMMVGLIYMSGFARVSGGTLTVTLGLLAWAAVFPIAEFCDHLGIVTGISPEVWNIPKYFVAFGMILILLEEEIIAANEASGHYRLLFEANPHPMWIYDRETLALKRVNAAAIAQYGYSRDEFLNMTLMDISSPGDIHQATEQLRNAGPNQQLTGPWRHQKRDGSIFLVDIATHQTQSNGRPLAFSLMQDVTERQGLHEQLLYQANHDRLTGLPNRALLEERMGHALAHSQQHGLHAALLCLDIDRFKQINDTYGHNTGDLCLQEAARRLTAQVRGMDIVARAGGEEFSLLIHEVKDQADAERVAEAALLALQAPMTADGHPIELTASIGIAICPRDGHDTATLWRSADTAMYRAKKAGGNQYLCMSPEIGALTFEANEMERQIRRALKGEGLELHYQPIYKLSGELSGLEALVRLRDIDNSLIAPSRFISIAEESGLIVPLGDWVLKQVCTQSAAWRSKGLPPIRIALNISPLQITRPNFANQVASLLAQHHMAPCLLGMEITETAVMRDITEASRQIKILADMGIAFSVDDFGTGYSSLGQLDQLPVQTLKIDRTFIDRICTPTSTSSIVGAIISMAHSLGLEVVAEGVENEQQFKCLCAMKCDSVQGYFFSRPLPAHEMEMLLQRESLTRSFPTEPSTTIISA